MIFEVNRLCSFQVHPDLRTLQNRWLQIGYKNFEDMPEWLKSVDDSDEKAREIEVCHQVSRSGSRVGVSRIYPSAAEPLENTGLDGMPDGNTARSDSKMIATIKT